jgi:5-methylcytosine-specific restriction endonuclease McrA
MKNRGSSRARRAKRNQLHVHQEGKCFWCTELVALEQSTMDELLPVSKGGGFGWDNVVMSCRLCNLRRSDTLAPPSAFEAVRLRESLRRRHKLPSHPQYEPPPHRPDWAGNGVTDT